MPDTFSPRPEHGTRTVIRGSTPATARVVDLSPPAPVSPESLGSSRQTAGMWTTRVQGHVIAIARIEGDADRYFIDNREVSATEFEDLRGAAEAVAMRAARYEMSPE